MNRFFFMSHVKQIIINNIKMETMADECQSSYFDIRLDENNVVIKSLMQT